MYRFLVSPKWIAFHLLVVLGVAAMIWLGFWQLRRLDERREQNAVIEANLGAVPTAIAELVPADAILGDPRLDDVEWRPLVATGTYVAGADVSIFNRSQNGTAGSFLVTPLALDDGRVLLVARGFYPLDVTPPELPPAPAGPVEVVGRVRPSQARQRGGITEPTDGPLTEAARVDIERLAPQLAAPVVPVYVELVSSTPAQAEGFPDPIPPPTPGEGSHLSYAVQWFIFATCALVGWVLAVRRSLRTRRRGLAVPSAISRR